MKNRDTSEKVINGKDFDQQASRRKGNSRQLNYGYHNVERQVVEKNVLWKYSSYNMKEEITATGPTTNDYDLLVYLTEKSTFLIDISYVQENGLILALSRPF